MATCTVIKPRFYPCLKRGIKAEIVPESRARGLLYLALYLVYHGILILISVAAFTDLLEISWPHYLKPDSKVYLKVASVLLTLISLCVHVYIAVVSYKRARAEMEGRPYESDQPTSASRQQPPQEESGVDLSGRRDERYRYDRDWPTYFSRHSIIGETETAPLRREQREGLRITEESNEHSPSGELEFYANAPIVEEPESDDAPSVEHNLADNSPRVEVCELDDYTQSTAAERLYGVLQQITQRSRHPSKSEEQVSSASHDTQDAAVYETNSEETEV